jgi:uncharacterized membrane protein
MNGSPRHRALVLASILTYVAVFTWYTFAKHAAFKTYAWDLGIYGQAFWTTVNVGGVFRYNCELHLVDSGSFFGVHFSPALFLILPIYILRQDVTTLLLVQSAALGLSAYPVYLLGREALGEGLGAAVALAYLLNPSLHGVNCYDFHVQALLPLTLGYLTLYTHRRQWARAGAAAVLSLSVMEQVTYILLVYAAALAAGHLARSREDGAGNWKLLAFAAALALTSLAWSHVAAQVIGHYNPDVPEYLRAGRHFSVLGAADPSEVPLRALTQPRRALDALLHDSDDKAAYLLGTLSPTMFAALAEPLAFAPAAAWLAVSLLSNYPPYYTLGFQYLGYTVPFTQAAATLALGRLGTAQRRRMATALVLVAAASSLGLSPLSPATDGMELGPAYRRPEALDGAAIRAALDAVPPGASILTQDNVFPHVCGRARAYVIPPDTRQDPETQERARRLLEGVRAEYVLVDLDTDTLGTAEGAALAVEQTGDYSLLMGVGSLRLYRLDPGLVP